MNFLAHIYLSGEGNEGIFIGNFIADFVKGKEKEKYSAEVRAGIELHYQIDQFTDQHACFRQSTERLKLTQGKYASVLVDVFYDHFLAIHWKKFHSMDLVHFNEQVFQRFTNYKGLLPEKVQKIIPRMKAEKWLPHYATMYGIRMSLEGLNRRAKFSDQLPQALEILQNEYSGFEKDFLLFFPEMINFVAQIKPQ